MEPVHIKATPGDVAKKAVISGDPARVVQLSKLLSHRRLVSENRGFLTYTGEYEDEVMTVACHGIGGPSAAIIVEELIMLGTRAIVRLGSCGGLLKPMRVGDMVIATGAGYEGGTLDYYFSRRIRPKPDRELLALLEDSASENGVKCYSGRVFSSDAFYTPDSGFVRKLVKKGYIGIEMECATLFGLGRLKKVKTASLLVVSDNMVEDEPMVDAKTLQQYVPRAGKIVFDGLNRLRV